jgi:hypothetical protein
MTPEEVRELEIKYRGWGLENGDFFDGARFRDMEGHFLPHHPSKILKIELRTLELDELLEIHLGEENAKIGSANRLIEKEWKVIEQMWE